MSGVPWLAEDGSFRCFLCSTAPSRTGKERDPDAWNDDLRESHRLLWSRPLPTERAWSFEAARGWYLKCGSSVAGEPADWSIGSDNVATTHSNSYPQLAAAIPGYENRHLHEFCTIGGYLVFPNGRDQTRATQAKPRSWTINQAKGCDRRIFDRIDLTLEAIRLYYAGVISRDRNPLGDVLDADGGVGVALWSGHDGSARYVAYFCLEPFVSAGRVTPLLGDRVDFADAAPGRSAAAYADYIAAQRAAVTARNALITATWTQLSA